MASKNGRKKNEISPWVQIIPHIPKMFGYSVFGLTIVLSAKEFAGRKTIIDADIDISTGASWADVAISVLSNPLTAWALLLLATPTAIVLFFRQKSLRKRETERFNRWRDRQTSYQRKNRAVKKRLTVKKQEDRTR